ncbi:unnamed protein product [Adineta steineri]|uniref:Uncharacterized protein n=1 Tax=Adineta steineri TaxID=433720 RepID=A0A813N8Y3_9BILA|nr:unnamed protein product [Adineta steineri]
MEKSLIIKDLNYERLSLVWFDYQISHLPEYVTLQEKLRNIINYLKIFENVDQCEQYIRSIFDNDRVIIIINYESAQEIISHIHSLRQVDSIYIYNVDEKINKKWIEKYFKIKCMVVELDELIIKIESNLSKIDESFAIFSFKTNINQDQSITELNNQFLYSQIIMDCLLRIENNLSDRTQLISLCQNIYKDNKIQLNHIKEFEKTYTSNQALLWYTKDIFLSKILNKALSIQNIDILFLCRFFLYDIREQLIQNQYPSSIHLYRTLIISIDELQILKDTINGFITINTFFTAKFNRQSALDEFDQLVLTDNLQRILFEIDAHPQLDNIQPFSTINSSEILFMSGSIFHLDNIILNDDQLWVIHMTLTNSNHENLITHFDSMNKKIQYNKNQINKLTFGNILWRMNKLDEAEKYYLYMIDLLPTNDLNLPDLYYNLGHIYSDKKNYDLSLKWYNKSLEIWIKILKSNDPDLANNYNAIATNYLNKGDYKQAFDSFDKALNILRSAYGDDHLSIAMCLNNMGTVITIEKNYSKALDYYLKALTLFQKYLPNNNPNLASLHCNISTIYKHLNQIDFVLEHLNYALKIYENSLPLEYSNIIMVLKNIAFLYEQKEDYQQALIYYKKISDIYQQTLTLTDPVVVQNEEKIQYLLTFQHEKHSFN